MAQNRNTMGTNIDQGIVSRIAAGFRYITTGKSPADWFGPLEPLTPVAPPTVAGRQFDYPTGYNLQQQPRSSEKISFAEMRALADSYDLLRLVIETRKDQLARMRFVVKPKDSTKKPDEACKLIQSLLEYPDREHEWDTWLRALLEDLLVCDAPCIYPRLTKGGGLYSLELMDGTTIKRVIGFDGRTPAPPDPAYQQIIKGLPAVDYTIEELIYKPRNYRTNRVYGFSPVEQVIMTVNIALRRQLTQLTYYTEGNVPEALIGVPENWTVEQIKQFQTYWDSLVEGNPAFKRHAKFVPGGMEYQPTRSGDGLKDQYDEWLARVICFAFSISPQPFVEMMNRATAETAQETAVADGLSPLMNWVKSTMDLIIHRYFKRDDIEFSWQNDEELDPKSKAEIHQIYINAKALTVDEVRADLGKDPLTPEQLTAMKEMAAPPVDPNAQKPEGEDDKGASTDKKPKKAAGKEGDEGTQKADQPDVNVHVTMPPITVNNTMPEVSVTSPDVIVDVGATTVKAEFTSPQMTTKTVTKTVTAERMPDGSLRGVVQEVDQANNGTISKAYRGERNADGSFQIVEESSNG